MTDLRTDGPVLVRNLARVLAERGAIDSDGWADAVQKTAEQVTGEPGDDRPVITIRVAGTDHEVRLAHSDLDDLLRWFDGRAMGAVHKVELFPGRRVLVGQHAIEWIEVG